MKRITFLGVLLVVTLLVSPILVYSAAGPPGGLDMKVINDATEPVPVTGEVTAIISGDVKVVSGAVERVRATASGRIEADAFNDLVNLFEVPDDKVLVVEYVSVTARVRDNPLAGVSLFAEASGGHVIGVLEKTGSSGGGGVSTDAIGKVVRFSTASGSPLNLLLRRPNRDPANHVSFSVTISGFLEDAPLD